MQDRRVLKTSNIEGVVYCECTVNVETFTQYIFPHISRRVLYARKFDLSVNYKLKCCEFKGKQASIIESTSLCWRSYSVLYVIDQKNEWSVSVE